MNRPTLEQWRNPFQQVVQIKTPTLVALMSRRDELRRLSYRTDAITAELERLHRMIERELWSASE